jgi:hypothetical protein
VSSGSIAADESAAVSLWGNSRRAGIRWPASNPSILLGCSLFAQLKLPTEREHNITNPTGMRVAPAVCSGPTADVASATGAHFAATITVNSAQTDSLIPHPYGFGGWDRRLRSRRWMGTVVLGSSLRRWCPRRGRTRCGRFRAAVRRARACPASQIRRCGSPVRAMGSETLLARMIENVIENAVHHSPRRGLIEITLALDGDQARLSVDTDGPLLDRQRVAALAQPFRRLGQERTYPQTGHGLGLSIVAAVAAAHGGTLLLHARPEGGLQVQITLPRATAAQLAGASR